MIDFPTVENCLPEMMGFVSELVTGYQAGEIQSWSTVAERVHTFFTPEMMDEVETVVPGWRKMASYADGMTLVHVMVVYTGLLTGPEYQQASGTQQQLLKWIVLFHDIAKQVRGGRGDHIHGFWSAAMSGATLPKIGFAVTPNYDSDFDQWFAFVNTAITESNTTSEFIQDNSKLPKIIEGINQLFGHNTPAALIVKTVLLHMSINVIDEYPNTAPLTESEAVEILDDKLLPLLKAMMLADSDGWNLFRQPVRERYRNDILKVFDRLEAIIVE